MRPTPALAYRASIAASCVVAAARLLPYLGDRVMHRDEALAVMVARRPLGELLETVQLVRGGAPLHFLLAKLVAELGGGLVYTRAISVVGLLLAIVGVGLLGRALAGPAVGAAAAWIVALSPVALYYGDSWMPLKVWASRSHSTNASPTRRRVTSAMTTMPGSATP